MSKINLDIIAGTRPNFVKIASLCSAMEDVSHFSQAFEIPLIHTGKHYDFSMSESFFDQLGLPEPDYNFDVGPGTHAEQTGAIMVAYEQLLSKKSTDLCIVVGDVNSTMACTLTAKKMNIPVAHIKGGIRSNDLSMPEEINRVVTDSINDYFFTTTKLASTNLVNSGINREIFFVGNTMIDMLKYDRRGEFNNNGSLVIEVDDLISELQKIGFESLQVASEGCLHLDSAVAKPRPFFKGKYKGFFI